jgi:tRNA U38,U39,U40 pseudouridine synthase TruA
VKILGNSFFIFQQLNKYQYSFPWWFETLNSLLCSTISVEKSQLFDLNRPPTSQVPTSKYEYIIYEFFSYTDSLKNPTVRFRCRILLQVINYECACLLDERKRVRTQC